MERFNALSLSEAEEQLYACLANRRWAARLAAGRPYRTLADLVEAAELEAERLTELDWREAIASHPRIGERGGHSPQASAHEQSSALQSSSATLDALRVENRRYEDRFGHVFLIAASGRSGEEILAELRRRMNNDTATELDETKRELRRIVQLRLRAMVAQ